MQPRAHLARCLGIALAVAVLLLLVDLQPRRGAGEPRVESWQQAGALRVGFARVCLDPPDACPLGGFAARRGAPADTVLDPVGASAMVLNAGQRSVALVAVDLVLVPDALRAAVAARVELDALWLAATHSHAGPGGYWDNALAEALGLGRFDPLWADSLAARIARSVERARAALQPAELSWGRRASHGLARPRSNRDRSDQAPLVVIEARRAGRQPGAVLGGLVVHAAHPTLLGKRSRALSAGWPGHAARALGESPGGEWLVLQGPGGDLSPPPRPLGTTPEEWIAVYGRAVAGAVRAVALEPVLDPGIGAALAVVSAPRADATGLVGPPLTTLVSSALGWFARDSLRVDLLRLGPLALLGVGAEPVRSVGRALGDTLHRRLPGAAPVIVSLTNGYLGYVEAPEAVVARRGEARRVYYGPALQPALIDLSVAAARSQSSSQTQ